MDADLAIRSLIEILGIVFITILILHEDKIIQFERRVKRYFKCVKRNFKREFGKKS